jgi:hypothetical protein
MMRTRRLGPCAPAGKPPCKAAGMNSHQHHHTTHHTAVAWPTTSSTCAAPTATAPVFSLSLFFFATKKISSYAGFFCSFYPPTLYARVSGAMPPPPPARITNSQHWVNESKQIVVVTQQFPFFLQKHVPSNSRCNVRSTILRDSTWFLSP